MDVFTIIAVILAFLVGLFLYYIYSKGKGEAVDTVYGVIKEVFDNYGDKLKEDNPQLYGELEDAMKAMDDAMSDKEITIMEAYNIALSIIPLMKRLTKFVESKYKG